MRSAISAALICGHSRPSIFSTVNIAGAWFQSRPVSS